MTRPRVRGGDECRRVNDEKNLSTSFKVKLILIHRSTKNNIVLISPLQTEIFLLSRKFLAFHFQPKLFVCVEQLKFYRRGRSEREEKNEISVFCMYAVAGADHKWKRPKKIET
jgi:hypothetical protein